MELVIACVLTVYGAYCDTPPPVPFTPVAVVCGPFGCDVGVPRREPEPNGYRYRGNRYDRDRDYDERRYHGDGYRDGDSYDYPRRRCYMAGGVRVCN